MKLTAARDIAAEAGARVASASEVVGIAGGAAGARVLPAANAVARIHITAKQQTRFEVKSQG